MRKYIFRKRVGGRLITRSLGSTATLTLQQARKMAVVLAGDLVGQKVAQERVQDNLETPTPIASTGTAGDGEHLFRSVYLPAIEARRYSAHWEYVIHAEQWVITIETYAVNKLGDIDVKNITDDELHALVDQDRIEKEQTETTRIEDIYGRGSVTTKGHVKKPPIYLFTPETHDHDNNHINLEESPNKTRDKAALKRIAAQQPEKAEQATPSAASAQQGGTISF